MAPKQAQWWLPLALFLAVAAAVGGVLLSTSLRGGQPVEIVLPTPTPMPTPTPTPTVTVPHSGEDSSRQKIDINTAEPWLLETLPGIGEVRARAIVDYRTQNGPFRTVEDVLKVPGIGPQTYERIKNLITVGDIEIVPPTPTPTPTVPRSEEVSAPQKININTAGPQLLETLPGIGPVKAKAIVDFRNTHGPFRSLEDLDKVPGIGPATLNKIKDKITVGD